MAGLLTIIIPTILYMHSAPETSNNTTQVFEILADVIYELQPWVAVPQESNNDCAGRKIGWQLYLIKQKKTRCNIKLCHYSARVCATYKQMVTFTVAH